MPHTRNEQIELTAKELEAVSGGQSATLPINPFSLPSKPKSSMR